MAKLADYGTQQISSQVIQFLQHQL